MPATIDDILPDALALSDDSKLLLAERLLESVSENAGPDEELLAEIARRRAEAEADPSLLIPAEEVLREVRAALAAHEARP